MNSRYATSQSVEFAGPLTLRTVEEAKARLQAVLAAGCDLEIDCAAATEVDLSGAQLLLSAAKTAVQDGRRAWLIWPSSGVLQRTLSRAGLVETFERLFPASNPEALQ